jgi:hypothetical protein
MKINCNTKKSSKSKVFVYGGQEVSFEVKEWEKETTEADKKNGVTWLRQTESRKVLSKVHAPLGLFYYLTLPKNLCGIYSYYIEASLSGKTDVRPLGLHVIGSCEAKISKAHWVLSPNGAVISGSVNKGSTVYLDIATEGLNGYKTLAVEIYNTKDEKTPITTLQSQKVVDGSTFLELKTNMLQILEILESFYVKIKNPNTGHYVHDGNKNEKLASFLQVSNAFVLPSFLAPTSIVPSKVGQVNSNYTNHAPCRYDKIIITDKDSNKDHFDVNIYDCTKNATILNYETIAGANETSKKELKLSYKKYNNKQCFNKGSHKKEVEIFIDGVKQKTEVINGENVTVDLVAKANTFLLRSNPEIFFITPDPTTKYQIIAKTCAQPIGILNVNVYPNVEREVAFVLTMFKTFNAEINQKFSTREKLTDYNKTQSMQLIRNELEILYQTKGGLGYGFSAKVKVDNIESSIELGTTQNQIKKLIGFYNTVQEVTSVFDGRGREEKSIAYSSKKLPKVTFDIEPPNIALALRITNKKINKSNEIVRQLAGALALKPITKIKIGVDLLSLLQYMGIGGKIANWIKEELEEKYNFTIYVIFEVFLEAKAELSLTYNKVEGFAPGARKLQLEAGVGIKGGVKSTEFVSVLVPEPDGKLQEVKVEKFKGEASAISSILYTYEVNADIKGQYSQHKMEFTGVKATIVVYAIRRGMKYDETFRKDFTIVGKPSKPWYESDKDYTI